MPRVLAKIAIWSNNPYLQSLFVRSTFSQSIEFVDYKKTTTCPYIFLLVDLSQDLSDISQRVIDVYDHCRTENQKLAVVLLHGEKVDNEKNLYFAQLLDRLGGGAPLHRLVFTKDIYQENLLDSETWLEKYILESLVNRKINISSKGENNLHPLSAGDFAIALQKIFFLSGTAGKSFWIVGDPLTDLELAYLIKKNLENSDEQYEIEATESNNTAQDLNSLGNQARAALNWEPVDDFTLQVRSSIRRMREDKTTLLSQIHHLEATAKHPRLFKIIKLRQNLEKVIAGFKFKKKDKKIIETSQELLKKILEGFLAATALVYLLITVSFITFTVLSLINLEKSFATAREGNILGSVQTLKNTINYGKIGESSYSLVSSIFSVMAPGFHEKNHNLFVFLDYSESSLENLQQTYLLAEKIYQSIGNTNTNLNYNDASLALRSNLSQVYENINQIKLLTQEGKLPDILENKLTINPEFKNISIVEQQVVQLLKSAELIPAFLAGDTSKNIVVLFQNSNELRSTGGVIEYVLALVMEHGRIVSKNVYTGLEIDNFISDEIKAPYLVNLYTGAENWRMRDLNYNPDFTATAGNVSTIIEKSLKFKPDVIVAVNQSLISGFLNENRGILLNGQNITKETFETDLPKTSPSQVYRQLIDYYTDRVIDHKLSLLALGRVMAQQSMEDQIFFWTKDENIQKSISEQSFSGAVYQHTCHPAVYGAFPCLAETTYLNESNFSLVPIGQDLQKKVIHRVSFDSGSVKHEYLISYKFSREFTGLNRDLNEVLQVYAPAGSMLGKALINDKEVLPTSIFKQTDNHLERFQIPISLKFNLDNTVIIDFESPLGANHRLPFSYSLTEHRQPGQAVGNGNVELIVNVPDSARASLITAPAVSSPGGFSYIFPAKTTTFGISFEPKVH